MGLIAPSFGIMRVRRLGPGRPPRPGHPLPARLETNLAYFTCGTRFLWPAVRAAEPTAATTALGDVWGQKSIRDGNHTYRLLVEQHNDCGMPVRLHALGQAAHPFARDQSARW